MVFLDRHSPLAFHSGSRMSYGMFSLCIPNILRGELVLLGSLTHNTMGLDNRCHIRMAINDQLQESPTCRW